MGIAFLLRGSTPRMVTQSRLSQRARYRSRRPQSVCRYSVRFISSARNVEFNLSEYCFISAIVFERDHVVYGMRFGSVILMDQAVLTPPASQADYHSAQFSWNMRARHSQSEWRPQPMSGCPARARALSLNRSSKDWHRQFLSGTTVFVQKTVPK